MARRALIPLAECGLLSRTNARRYCGCLGEESFDRVIGPHVTPRLIGRARFYARKELDAWIDGIGQPARETWSDAIRRAFPVVDPAAHAAEVNKMNRMILAALRVAKRPCSAQDLTRHTMMDRGMDVANRQLVREEEQRVRGRLHGLEEEGLIRRATRTVGGRVAWEVAQL